MVSPSHCENESKFLLLEEKTGRERDHGERRARERKEPQREGSGGEETLWTLFDLHIWGTFKNVILRSRVGPNVISVTEPN